MNQVANYSQKEQLNINCAKFKQAYSAEAIQHPDGHD